MEEQSPTIARLQREIRKRDRRIQLLQSGEEIILSSVEQVFEDGVDLKVGKLPKKPKTKSVKNGPDEIAVVHISDLHVGKVTSTFNSMIAAERLEMLAEQVIANIESRRLRSNINEIHVYLGGDMIEGEVIFPHQAHLIDAPVIDQAVNIGPAMMARFVISMLMAFPKVKVCCVPGNHGRVNRKGTPAHPKTNWDRVFYKVTKMMLDTADAKGEFDSRLEWVEAEDFYLVDYVFDWGNLLTHGDLIRGGFAGFPWYGVGRKMMGWQTSIEEPWNYLWIGHFHTLTKFTQNTLMCLANGSVESDNTYARAELAACGAPVQRLAIFQESGLIDDIPIYLRDRRPRR